MTSIWVLLFGCAVLLCAEHPRRQCAVPAAVATAPTQAWSAPRVRDPRLLCASSAVGLLTAGIGVGAPSWVWPLLALAGWCGCRWIQQRPARLEPLPELPLLLDVISATLRSGQSLPNSLTLTLSAAPSAMRPALQRTATLLHLGAAPEQAWSHLHADHRLRMVVQTAIRSADSGSALAAGFERSAQRLRTELAAADLARAQRAGVRMVLPLTLCFLPAFVCMGVIPVAAGILRQVIPGVTR